ncbi:MAG: VCBS repeat-containing protein, partial [Cyanobacteria bacterium J06621_12]
MTDFTKIEADLTGIFSGSVATGDFDGDGDRDILITGAIGLENEGTIFIEDQTSEIYINDGTGGFSEDTEANLIGVDDSSVATGDFDGDGDLDLLITGESEGGNVAKIYLNDGAGGFSEDTEASLTGVESGSVSVGDFDGDDDLDLLITGRTGETEDGEIAEIYLNDGAGGFSEDTEASLTGVEFSTTSTGDFDDDGDLDLLITGFDNVANSVSSIYLNDGLGGFSKDNSNSLVGVSFGSVATGDFDGDSDIDLFLTGNGSRTGQFYTNDGTGSFSLNTDANPDGFGNFDGSISTGDYDNDGDLD